MAIETESRTTMRAKGVAASVAGEAVTAAPPAATKPLDLGLESGSVAIRASKRVFDVVIASLAILVLAPALLIIALLIRLDSPGPVFFRSLRVGRNGEQFWMLKFRTMVDGADERRNDLRPLSDAPDGLFKLRRDPRLTRIGRKLRAYSLDEMPQLFHVMTGKMSLVGPRPLPPEEDALIQGAGLRMQARPGLTGPWQLAGSWQVPLTEMIELDDEYLTGWSLWGDVKLLARTVPYVVRRNGV
jgi:lipopolysaccharide/colanic/teichoic acid biosynthesis glycosyltransferase